MCPESTGHLAIHGPSVATWILRLPAKPRQPADPVVLIDRVVNHYPPGTLAIASTSTKSSGLTRAATMTVLLAGGLLGQVSERTLL